MGILELINQVQIPTNNLKIEKIIKSKKKISKQKLIKDENLRKIISEEYYTTSIEELCRKYDTTRKIILRILKEYHVPKLERTNFGTILSINEDYFQNIDTADKAYFLGFITGDGCVGRKKNTNKLYLTIGLADKDIEILEKFKFYTKSSHKLRTFKRITNFKKTRNLNGCSIYITIPKFIKHIVEHGITPDKSKELDFPTTIPDHLMCHYFRGLLDSDGYWCFSPNAIFGILSSVKSFLEECKVYLQKSCNAGDPSIYSKKGCYVLIFGGNVQCKRIYDYIYGSGGPWLERKYLKAKNYFETNCQN